MHPEEAARYLREDRLSGSDGCLLEVIIFKYPFLFIVYLLRGIEHQARRARQNMEQVNYALGYKDSLPDSGDDPLP